MRLVLDVEANGLNEVAIDGNKITPEATIIHCAVAHDLDSGTTYKFTPENIVTLPSLLNKASLIIGHNIFFDISAIRKILGNFKCTKYHDTLIISKLMYPDINNHPLGDNSLQSWGKFLKNDKIDYKGGWEKFSDEMLVYCTQDVMLTADIFRYQQSVCQVPERVIKFEHLVSKILSEQTFTGFGYDAAGGDRLIGDLLIEKAQIEDEMRTIFPDKVEERWSTKTGKRLKDKIEVFNPGSRQQIASRLFDKYGWEAPLTDKGNPKVDESVLSKLDYPEAKKLVQYFDCIKLMGQVEDWNTRIQHSRDGRVHGLVNAQGAATGRCTHSQPNMAQVSKDKRARALFCPLEPEHVLVGSDLQGLELRMLSHFMAKYDNGKYGDKILNDDIHTYNQKAAGLPNRDAAKTFIYAYCYGAGDEKLGKIIGGNRNAGSQIRAKFQKEIPALDRVQQEVKFSVTKIKGVQLPDGRIVPVRSEHAALNTLLQGSGAIVSKLWMCIAYVNLKKKFGDKVKQVAYVHDELQYSCHKDIADEVGKTVTAAATEAGQKLGLKIRIDANYSIGSNWSETH
jgi:DNA polymerase I-like protein with 3'-5' exonuclease and polymerase domains